MSRFKQHIGRNVLEMGRERIHHIYDTHDTPIVLFSGGKDSQVLMHLAWEVAQERGCKFVNAVFIHDEFTIAPIIDLIRHYADMPWVRMHHIIIPDVGMRYVFNKPMNYRQWDYKNREMIRPIPEYAIRPTEALWYEEWFQHEAEEYQCQFFVGKVAQMNGIRANESRFRWRASVNKLVDNYINNPLGYKKATLCKPLYDWEDNDILKYLYDNKIPYSKVYDWQLFAKMEMRTSPWLHPEKIRHLKKLRQIDPQFYEQILKIFPDQVVHDRYGEDRDDSKVIEKYGNDGLEGVLAYINDYYTDESARKMALHRLHEIQQLRKSDRNRELDTYPIEYVLKYFIRGQVWKLLLPYRKGQKEWRNLV